MKTKLFAIVLAAISFAATASAQQSYFGIKAGLNLATISCTYDNDCSMKPGFNVGFVVDCAINSNSAITTELFFSQQGTKEPGELSGVDYVLKTNLNYLNLPIMYNAELAKGFHIKFGVQPGLFISGKEVIVADDESISDGIDSGLMNTFDVSIPVGIAIDITDHLYIDARYSIGVYNIVQDTGSDRVRNSVCAISLGCRF